MVLNEISGILPENIVLEWSIQYEVPKLSKWSKHSKYRRPRHTMMTKEAFGCIKASPQTSTGQKWCSPLHTFNVTSLKKESLHLSIKLLSVRILNCKRLRNMILILKTECGDLQASQAHLLSAVAFPQAPYLQLYSNWATESSNKSINHEIDMAERIVLNERHPRTLCRRLVA